jgi:hypothetical protein
VELLTSNQHGIWYHEVNFRLVSLPASFNVWLASPEARFLKGKFLWANWDVNELKAKAQEIEAGAQFSIGLVGWPFGNENWALNLPGKP